jgi:hypothetical protein
VVLLAVFALFTIFSLARAEGRWKLWNLLIIIGSCAVGFFVAYLAGVWSRNMALGGEIAVPTTLAFGSFAAVLCPRKKRAPNAQVP